MRKPDLFSEWKGLLEPDEPPKENRSGKKNAPAPGSPVKKETAEAEKPADRKDNPERLHVLPDKTRNIEAVREFMKRVERSEGHERPLPRQRVEFDEALKRLPEEIQRYIKSRVDDRADWHLERRRRLFTWLVRRETRPVGDTVVEIDHRFSLRRSEPVHDTQDIDQHIEAALTKSGDENPEEDLYRATRTLPDGDEVRVRAESDGQTVIFILRSEGIERVSPDETKPVQKDAPTATQPEADSTPSGTVEVPIERLDESFEVDIEDFEVPGTMERMDTAGSQEDGPRETVESVTISPETTTEPERAMTEDSTAEIPELPEGWFEETLDEVWNEELNDAQDGPDGRPVDSIDSQGTPPAYEAPADSKPVNEILQALADHADKLEDLPPVAGGSPELDEEPRRRRRRTEVVVKNAPRRDTSANRPDRRIFLPLSAAGEQVAVWERGWTESRAVPGDRLKRSARKLIRLLARRYGIRMTPELEAYLLEIALRPSVRGGTRIFSLAANRDDLVRTIQVIWLNYNGRFSG